MNVGSLFSGIGGLDLGLERAGMTVKWQSEIDPYASKVLAKHWPDVPNLGDVTTIDWSQVEPVDLICGGYPCQPFSLAGVRRGESDPRHLWPHFHRAIRHLRPRYALLENVPGHLSMGFDRVLGDLAESGYGTEWCSIPAAAVGAPHLRWRMFCVATDTHADEFGCGWQQESDVGPSARIEAPRRSDAQRLRQDVADAEVFTVGAGLRPDEPGGQRRRRPGDGGSPLDVADADGTRLEERRPRRPTHDGDHWTVEPDVRGIPDGLPQGLDGGLDACDRPGSDGGTTQIDELVVRVMRQHQPSPPTSRGRGPDEQLAEQLADALRVVSHPMALGTRQEAVASTLAHLHRLRQACEAAGAVRDPSLSIAEAWQSLPSETQGWAIVGARRGTWHTEWPDIPRVATGVANRVDRLRCLGNAVVPQVAQWIGERIMQAAA